MEVAECTKIVLSRIQEIEPKDVTKIIGYLLLQHNQEEICAYAYGPDGLIHSLISEAKAFLSSSPSPLGSLATSQLGCITSSTVSRSFSSPSSFRVAAPRWVNYLATNRQPAARNLEHPLPVHNELAGGVHNQADFLNVDEQLQPLGPDFFCNYYHPDALAGGCLGSSAGMRSPSGVPGFASRTCHYSDGGLCKNGIDCSYTHGQGLADCFSPIYNQNMNEQDNKDHVFAPGSLEKLELEIEELLRAGGGEPVSIAVLPMVYHEMYGRMLQAEGYLSESQRHGKTGYNLTKLLARLRNIRLIDRPNGQHSVVLVEDYAKYMDCRNGRSDSRALPGSSHQIYLTFPAESTFTEVDVADYFKQYGPVNDVRIPRQEKRMFGFVSFVYPETVKLILAKGHPHYISGARVLVKPYKEKSKMNGRKYAEKIEFPMYCHQYCEMDPYLNSIPRAFQRIQEHEDFLEFERMRLSELQLNPKPVPHHYFVNGTDEFRFSEDHLGPLSFPDKCSMTAEKLMHRSNSFSDQDSGHIELPDSPFASPR